MNAKEFLKQVLKLDKMIENKIYERNHWKSIALNVTAGSADVNVGGVTCKLDKVQTSGNPHKMEDAIVKYVDIEAEINAAIDELVDTKKNVICVIEQLNPLEYDLLHKVYIQHISLDDVADACGKTYSWATTVHGRGLKSVQKILDARECEP